MLLQIAVAPAGTYVKQTSLEDRACLRTQLLTNLDELIERAHAQHDALERERIAASRRALGNANAS